MGRRDLGRWGIAAALLLLTCSRPAAPLAEAGGQPETSDRLDDPPIVPEGLQVVALPGGNGVLEVKALTLRRGQHGVELLAALENRGRFPACSAAFAVELFDRSERSVAAGIGGLLTQRFYRRVDGSEAIAACVGPGDVTMVAVADLPEDLEIDQVHTVLYRCPYFALDVLPIDGLSVRNLEAVKEEGGTSYQGILVNGLDVAVDHPKVTVFAANHVGRPLAVVTGSAPQNGELAPGREWPFQTSVMPLAGPEHDVLAFPTGELAPPPAPAAP